MRIWIKRIVALLLLPAFLGNTSCLVVCTPVFSRPAFSPTLDPLSQEALSTISRTFFRGRLNHRASLAFVAAFLSYGAFTHAQSQTLESHESPVVAAMKNLLEASERWWVDDPSNTLLKETYQLKYAVALNALKVAAQGNNSDRDLEEAIRLWDQARGNAEAAGIETPVNKMAQPITSNYFQLPRTILNATFMDDFFGFPSRIHRLFLPVLGDRRLTLKQKIKWLKLLSQKGAPSYSEIMKSREIYRDTIAQRNAVVTRHNADPQNTALVAQITIAQAELDAAHFTWMEIAWKLGLTEQKLQKLLPRSKNRFSTPPIAIPPLFGSA